MSFFEFPNTRTYDSDLGWLIKNMKLIIDEIEGLEEWKEDHSEQCKELMKLYNDLLNGKFPESVSNAFNRWMRTNAASLISELIKNVYFGLTKDGYFVAYIPESWNDIIFNTTGVDIVIPDQEYGRLILSY